MSTGSVALVVPDAFGIPDLYELGIPAAVFGTPQPDLADPWYDLWLYVRAGRGRPPGQPRSHRALAAHGPAG